MNLTYEEALRRAVAAQRQGKTEEASELYSAILKVKPNDAVSNHNLGLIALISNNLNLAVKLLKVAVEVDPQTEQHWLSYIEALNQLGAIDAAKLTFDEAKARGIIARKSNPQGDMTPPKKNSPTTNNSLKNPTKNQMSQLQNLYQKGALQAVEQMAKDLVEQYPNNQSLWQILGGVLTQNEKHAEALRANDRAISLNSTDSIALSNSGNNFRALGQIDEAINRYCLAAKFNPSFAQAHSNLGKAFIQKGNFRSAKIHLTEALRLTPNSYEAYFDLGVLHDSLNELSQAQAFYTKAIKLNPNHTNSKFSLADIERRMERLDLAEKKFLSLLKKNPNHAPSYSRLGAIYLKQEKLTEASEALAKALEINPNSSEILGLMGGMFLQMGNPEKASKVLHKALELEPDKPELCANYGIALQQLDRLQEAETAHLKAFERHPNNSNFAYNLGVTKSLQGKFGEAVAWLNRSIGIDPMNANAYNALSVAHAKSGAFQQAVHSSEQAIELQPKVAEYHVNLGIANQYCNLMDQALTSFCDAYNLSPQNSNLHLHLLDFLTTSTSQLRVVNPIVTAHQKIKALSWNIDLEKDIDDRQIIDVIHAIDSTLSEHQIDLQLRRTQIYRRNGIDLGCNRHQDIFFSTGIIPEYCFGCYKVQIEPKSVIDLIKLFFIFDALELPQNNTRKCLVELRPQIKGFYKGLIYCSELDDAWAIKKTIESCLVKCLGANRFSASVKRGCSEYALAFPEYQLADESGLRLMQYDPSWKNIETQYDQSHQIQPSAPGMKPTNRGLNCSDALIFRNWIDYARGIRDPSVSQFELLLTNGDMFDIATNRLFNHDPNF